MLLDHVVDGLLTTMMMGSGCNLPPQPQHAHATRRTTKRGRPRAARAARWLRVILLLRLSTQDSRSHSEKGDGRKSRLKGAPRPGRLGDKRNIQGQINRPCGFDCFHISGIVCVCTQGQVSYGRARNATRGHREGKGMAKHRPGCSASFMPDGKIRTAISRAKRANMQDPHWKGRAKRARRQEPHCC